MNEPDFDLFSVADSAGTGARLVERHAARVHACEPAAAFTRTRDALQFDVQRDDVCVTLLVTAEALELRVPTVEWPTPYLPIASTRLWKRMLWSRIGGDQAALQALIDAAFQARRRAFVRCRFCRRPTPPEHRHGRVCHGCAEGHLGVVH